MAFPINDDAFCSRLLEHDEPVDAHAAYGRFMAQRGQARLWPRYAAGFALAAAAALVLGLAFTPLGTYAQSFLTIFEPKQLTAIDVSSLPANRGIHLELRDFGTVKDERMLVSKLPASHDVDAVAGYHVLKPAYLPASVPPGVRYKVLHSVSDAFTFSAHKARAAEARMGKPLPPMPRALDGTTVTLHFGPVVEQVWGADEPALTIEQMPVPVVRSSGATLAELEQYLLAMPDVSPQLATQIRAIADPSSTLPVPFRSTKQSAQHVRVHGVPALSIGDNTGVGAVVMWQSQGMLYVVEGPLREDEILEIANRLR
jgi:hypothetical protein